MAEIELKSISKSFDSNEVIKSLDLSISNGEFITIVGPSGCGKSTLLNIIGGLLPADSGKIELSNTTEESFEYGTEKPNKVVDVRRNGVGWIFQDFHLVEHLTALDNVAMALEISGIEQELAEEKAKAALTTVGLGDRIEFGAEQLSGGQRQRVAVARAIAGSRPLLLADEPTGNLDAESGNDIMKLFKLLRKGSNPISVLMVTHDPNLASQADRMLLMKDGVVAASDIKSAWGIDEEEEEEE